MNPKCAHWQKRLLRIANDNNIKVETCAEKIDLADLGIGHGRCIDDRLIAELTGVNLKMAKDKNQRELCGCVPELISANTIHAGMAAVIAMPI